MDGAAFYVEGLPIQQGALTCSRNPTHKLYNTNHEKLDPWRARVTAAARNWAHALPAGPVDVELTFSMPRPKDHYGTGRNAAVLKPSAPAYPTTKPDLDKLVRAILDALTEARVYPDDSCVVDVYARKRYAGLFPNGTHTADVLAVPGVVVRLYPVGEPL